MAEQTQSLAELQAEYESKIAKALAIAKTKLKTELDLLLLSFESLFKAGETTIWQDANIASILTSLGLQPTAPASPKRRGRKAGAAAKPVQPRKTRKGKRGGKQGERIIAALGSAHLATGEIARKISYTGANLSAVLAGMKKAGKIDKDKSNKWFVA